MVPVQQPKVALQLPTWGGVSVQLPVPQAPLLRRSALTSLRSEGRDSTLHRVGLWLARPAGWPKTNAGRSKNFHEKVSLNAFIRGKRFFSRRSRFLPPCYGLSKRRGCPTTSLLWLVFCLPPHTTPCRVVVGILAEHQQRWYPVDSSASCQLD